MSNGYHCRSPSKAQLHLRRISLHEQPTLINHDDKRLSCAHCQLSILISMLHPSARCVRQQTAFVRRLHLSAAFANQLPMLMSNAQRPSNSAISKLHFCLVGKPEAIQSGAVMYAADVRPLHSKLLSDCCQQCAPDSKLLVK